MDEDKGFWKVVFQIIIILILGIIALALVLAIKPVSAQRTFVTALGDDGSRTQYIIQGTAEDEINEAIDDLVNGGIVELSKGQFNINSSGTDYIKLHQSNVILKGQGWDTILYGMSGGNNVIVELLALEGEHVKNVGIRNLQITAAPDCYACGLGIGTLDAEGTLKNAFAEDLWIHDINWESGIGGGKGITMGSFAAGSVSYISLDNINVWDCGFNGIDTSHNYVAGGIRHLSIKNTNICGSLKDNLFIKDVDHVSLEKITSFNAKGNGAICNFCNDVLVKGLFSVGNGARGFLSGQSSDLFIYRSLFKDNGTSGVDIDDCTGYIYLVRSRITLNKIGLDVDNSIANLKRNRIFNNELDYRYINIQ